MTAPELCPCKICGGVVRYQLAYGIVCTSCPLRFPCTKAECVTEWNTRTAPIPTDARLVTVVQLERLLHSLGELDGETMLDEEIRNSVINDLRAIIGENGNG